MRYERKYIFRNEKLFLISSNLYSLGFCKAFPTRKINSIYYDTSNLALFCSSEAGLSERSKIRIRWYDDSEKEHLEYKVKKAELGKKNYLNNISTLNNLRKISIIHPNYKKILTRKIPDRIQLIYYPKVAISYKRNYYLSKCKTTRLTIDYDIKFGKILNYDSKYHINYWTPSESSVLEIKYNEEVNNEKIISKITQKLNLDLSRFSKYCQAISTVY